jgi:hypothetical protein
MSQHLRNFSSPHHEIFGFEAIIVLDVSRYPLLPCSQGPYSDSGGATCLYSGSLRFRPMQRMAKQTASMYTPSLYDLQASCASPATRKIRYEPVCETSGVAASVLQEKTTQGYEECRKKRRKGRVFRRSRWGDGAAGS